MDKALQDAIKVVAEYNKANSAKNNLPEAVIKLAGIIQQIKNK